MDFLLLILDSRQIIIVKIGKVHDVWLIVG